MMVERIGLWYQTLSCLGMVRSSQNAVVLPYHCDSLLLADWVRSPTAAL